MTKSSCTWVPSGTSGFGAGFDQYSNLCSNDFKYRSRYRCGTGYPAPRCRIAESGKSGKILILKFETLLYTTQAFLCVTSHGMLVGCKATKKCTQLYEKAMKRNDPIMQKRSRNASETLNLSRLVLMRGVYYYGIDKEQFRPRCGMQKGWGYPQPCKGLWGYPQPLRCARQHVVTTPRGSSCDCNCVAQRVD